MGVHGLTKLLTEHAPAALKKEKFSSYFGRTVAIDASMSIYQFLIAVRSEGMNLTNDAGENTSHLQGFFYRTIRMVENGIKPIYVFDGKPPASKSDEVNHAVTHLLTLLYGMLGVDRQLVATEESWSKSRSRSWTRCCKRSW